MSEIEPNPFQAPLIENLKPPTKTDPETKKPPHPAWSLLKWTVICTIAAAPSFVLALIATAESDPASAVAGMILGIGVFILGYTLLETRPRIQKFLKDRRMLLATRITYGLRVTISIIFPIALYVDIVCGMLAIYIVSPVLAPDGPGRFSTAMATFIFHFVTTIVQGILLNIVVLAVILLIFVTCMLFMRPNDDSQKSVPRY